MNLARCQFRSTFEGKFFHSFVSIALRPGNSVNVSAMLLASLILPTILSLVAGRPVPSKLGVEVTKVGKLKVAVDGSALKISNAACSGRYSIKYATTDTGTTSPGFCGLGESGGAERQKTMCTLKLDADGLLEINAMMIPPGCSVKLINAYFPEKEKEDTSKVPFIAIVILFVIFGSIFGTALLTVVICYYKRRKMRSRVSLTVSASAVQPSPSDSLPTALPSSTALEPKTSTDKPEASISSVPALKPPKKKTVKKVPSTTNNAMDEFKRKIRSYRFPIRSYRDDQPTDNESGIVNSFHYMQTPDSKNTSALVKVKREHGDYKNPTT